MSTSSNAKRRGAALIFLHGLGDTPAGWSSLEYSLPQEWPRLGNIRYVFPPAPTIPITINGGATMPGWFDLYDWPIGVSAKDDEAGVKAAVAQIRGVVRKLVTEEGIPQNRIVLGGFSQGGAIALQAAYTTRSDDEQQSDDGGGSSYFAGCIALSGWLTPKENLSINPEAARRTPLFWGHGQFDDKVLFEQQAAGIAKLEEYGVSSIERSSYPMGHSSHPQEIKAMSEFLERVLFFDESNNNNGEAAATKEANDNKKGEEL